MRRIVLAMRFARKLVFFALLVALLACSKDDIVPYEPTWPPIFSIAPDLNDFNLIKYEESLNSEFKRNWGLAIGEAHRYNYLDIQDLNRLVLTFMTMEYLELNYVDSLDSWQSLAKTIDHPYLTVGLSDSVYYECKVYDNQLEWNISFIQLGVKYPRIVGVTAKDNSSGEWTAYDFNGGTIYGVTWSASDVKDNPNLILRSERFEHKIELVVENSTLDREMFVSDLSQSQDQNMDEVLEVAWSTKDKSGYARSRYVYGDNEFHCWNKELKDSDCE